MNEIDWFQYQGRISTRADEVTGIIRDFVHLNATAEEVIEEAEYLQSEVSALLTQLRQTVRNQTP